jgi:hypothetical protein
MAVIAESSHHIDLSQRLWTTFIEGHRVASGAIVSDYGDGPHGQRGEGCAGYFGMGPALPRNPWHSRFMLVVGAGDGDRLKFADTQD